MLAKAAVALVFRAMILDSLGCVGAVEGDLNTAGARRAEAATLPSAGDWLQVRRTRS